MGLPLVVVGKMYNGARTTLSITPTDLKNLVFNPKELKTSQKIYQEGRRKWLKRYGGKLLKFIPYQLKLLSNKLKVHSIGYSYSLNQTKYEEMSYFINCKEQLYHLKSLLRPSTHQTDRQHINGIINNFQCGDS